MAGTEPSEMFDIPELTPASTDGVAGDVSDDMNGTSDASAEAAVDVSDDMKGKSDTSAEVAVDVSDDTQGTSEASVASAPPDAASPPLRRRLADAFRDGVASASPEYVKSQQGRTPPRATKTRVNPESGELLDRAIRQGRSAAVVVQEHAAVALEYAVKLARKTPAAAQNLAQAFRDGVTSVMPREGAEQKDRLPQSANEALAIVSHLNESAKKLFTGVVTALTPGPDREAWQGIHTCNRRNVDLYTEIGREAVGAWGDGPVATEKLTGLLDELRKNEEQIQKLKDEIAAGAAERTAAAARKRPVVRDVVAPAAEPVPEAVEAVDAAPSPETTGDAEQATFEEPVAIVDVRVEESVFVAPSPETTGDAEQAPSEEPVAIADGSVVEAAPQAEASGSGDQPLFEQPAAIAEVDADVADVVEAESQADASAGTEQATGKSRRGRKGLPKSTRGI